MKSPILSILIAAALAGSAWADSLDKIAKKLSEGAKKIKNNRVAVLPFPYHDGRLSKGSTIISERLTTCLVERKKLDVIERSLLENVLKELKLQASGAVDGETAKKIGKVLGVEAVINGTLIDLDEKDVEVNARLILVESGQILAAGSGNVARQWTEETPEEAPKEAPPQPQEAQAPAPNAPNGGGFDEGAGLEGLPIDAFLIESGFNQEAVRTPFGEEFIAGMKLIRAGSVRAAQDHFKKMHDALKGNPQRDNVVKLGYSLSLFSDAQRDRALKVAREVANDDRFPRIQGVARYVMGKYFESEGDAEAAKGEYLEVVRNLPFQTRLSRSAGQKLDVMRMNRREVRTLREVRRELRRRPGR